jgi:hemerythrin-like domain-containing protein
MQRPTDSLRADHATTSLALEVLCAIAGHVRARGSFPTADVAVLLRFLREFLLAVHLRKESDVVCPAVVMCGDERTAGLVGDLMRKHDEVSELLHSLVLFWEPVGDLTAAEQEGFADTADTLAARVHRMQELEENHLFPACEATVPADDLLGWKQQFAELERERGAAAAWRTRLEELAQRWVASN